MVDEQEEEPEVEYVEGYEMEDEDEDDAMEDFAQGANRMPDSEDGKLSPNLLLLFLVNNFFYWIPLKTCCILFHI